MVVVREERERRRREGLKRWLLVWEGWWRPELRGWRTPGSGWFENWSLGCCIGGAVRRLRRQRICGAVRRYEGAAEMMNGGLELTSAAREDDERWRQSGVFGEEAETEKERSGRKK
ncbi:hypothetical protein M0R45_026397 [Rubus argutus]|uniref:Uncharacterized protein n=1 Tax=Rubus argutus TaxID=59490 RepID=A0AAW1X009_RUBAR